MDEEDQHSSVPLPQRGMQASHDASLTPCPLPQTPPALQQKHHNCLIHCALFAVRVEKDMPKWMMSPTLMEQML